MSQLADRYAKALFETAKEKNNLEAVQESLIEIERLIHDLKDFRQFLSNPLLSYEDRCVILKSLFQGKMPDLLYKFLIFITFKNRLNDLGDIIQSFDNLYLLSTNQMRAYVTTASELEQGDRALISQRLHDKFHRNMLTTWSTDPSLIGGFRIFADGKIYDYSFKSQLNGFLQGIT